ncbi:MAG: hypothetical protein WCW52_06080 [Elusimicrobiales bacterium]|jgi:hypothetical protein
MEKEILVKCVPVEMMEHLKKLAAKLWEDRNPAGVHLGAILDEFESDIRTLSGVVKEYETDCAARFKLAEEACKEKILALERELAQGRADVLSREEARGESEKKAAALAEALKRKEAELSAAGARYSEEEAQLNSKYVSKMQELYDRVSRKELEMLSRWEEKNKVLEGKRADFENECSVRARQFKLREKTLEDGFNARKEELIRTFDKVRMEYDAREAELSAREEKLLALEKKRATVTEDL